MLFLIYRSAAFSFNSYSADIGNIIFSKNYYLLPDTSLHICSSREYIFRLALEKYAKSRPVKTVDEFRIILLKNNITDTYFMYSHDNTPAAIFPLEQEVVYKNRKKNKFYNYSIYYYNSLKQLFYSNSGQPFSLLTLDTEVIGYSEREYLVKNDKKRPGCIIAAEAVKSESNSDFALIKNNFFSDIAIPQGKITTQFLNYSFSLINCSQETYIKYRIKKYSFSGKQLKIILYTIMKNNKFYSLSGLRYDEKFGFIQNNGKKIEANKKYSISMYAIDNICDDIKAIIRNKYENTRNELKNAKKSLEYLKDEKNYLERFSFNDAIFNYFKRNNPLLLYNGNL